MTRVKSTGRELGLFPGPVLSCSPTLWPAPWHQEQTHLSLAMCLAFTWSQASIRKEKPTSNSSLARKHRRDYNSTDRKSEFPFHLLTTAICDREAHDTAKKINTLARCGTSNRPPFLKNLSLHFFHFCNFLCFQFSAQS